MTFKSTLVIAAGLMSACPNMTGQVQAHADFAPPSILKDLTDTEQSPIPTLLDATSITNSITRTSSQEDNAHVEGTLIRHLIDASEPNLDPNAEESHAEKKPDEKGGKEGGKEGGKKGGKEGDKEGGEKGGKDGLFEILQWLKDSDLGNKKAFMECVLYTAIVYAYLKAIMHLFLKIPENIVYLLWSIILLLCWTIIVVKCMNQMHLAPCWVTAFIVLTFVAFSALSICFGLREQLTWYPFIKKTKKKEEEDLDKKILLVVNIYPGGQQRSRQTQTGFVLGEIYTL